MLTLNELETVVVDSAEGYLWEDDQVTYQAEDIYQTGDCWVYAWAVAQLTGREIYLLLEDIHGDEYWTHAVVKMEEDSYFDILGPQSAAALEAKWDARLVPLTEYMRAPRDFRSYGLQLDTTFHYQATLEEASRLAALALNKIYNTSY